MADEIKKFPADYKKCTAKTKDCTVEKASRLRTLINNCHAGAGDGFYQLSDEVSTAQSKGVVGTKIEDYAKEKNVMDVLKGIKMYQADQLNHCNKMDELADQAKKVSDCLGKLAADITKDLKKRSTSSKSKPDIEKLGKQIAKDLDEFKAVMQKAKAVPPIYRTPGKEFASEVKKIVTANPAELAKTKYNEMAPRKMDTRILKKYVGQCTKAFKATKDLMDKALSLAKEGDQKAMADRLKAGKVELQKVLDIEKEYSNIKKNFQRDIDISKDKKEIESAISNFVKIRAAGEKYVSKITKEIRVAIGK